MNLAAPTLTFASILALASPGCGDNAGGGPDGAGAPDAGAAADAPGPRVGVTLFDFFIAVDVTPDGRIAAFEGLEGLEARLWFHDTITGAVEEKAVVGDPGRDVATGISATGRVSALHSDPVQAGLWTEAGGWLDLGSPHAAGCGMDVSGAFDVSADGHVAVGLAWDECAPSAFRWSDAGGTPAFTPLELLGTPLGGATPTNRATVISDDGSTIAGFASLDPLDRSPAVWDADGEGVLLDPDNHDAPGEVLSISADGRVLAGVTGFDGWVWTEAGGMTPLPRPELALPSDPVFPNAMSADGALVFGGVGNAFFSTPIAFVWDATHGTRALADVVTAAGVTLPAGLLFNSVLGASADGTVLIGTALDADFAPKTFTLVLPPGTYD
jgi:uncharacterized membrane protein